jgi:carboxymethylenebutenolidase
MSRIVFASGQEQIIGALAVPDGNAVVGGVVVVQEWWGLTPHIEDIAARWASEGFIALAPDLYRGEVASDAATAQRLMTELPRQRALADIESAVAALRDHPRCNGKIIVTGYCMGGSLSLRAACETRGLSGIVAFYGMPGPSEWSNIEAPVMLHVATRDDWVTPSAAEGLRSTLVGLGKTCDVHLYQADHAFCNDSRPRVYQAAEAALAWQRTVAFARKQT